MVFKFLKAGTIFFWRFSKFSFENTVYSSVIFFACLKLGKKKKKIYNIFIIKYANQVISSNYYFQSRQKTKQDKECESSIQWYNLSQVNIVVCSTKMVQSMWCPELSLLNNMAWGAEEGDHAHEDQHPFFGYGWHSLEVKDEYSLITLLKASMVRKDAVVTRGTEN